LPHEGEHAVCAIAVEELFRDPTFKARVRQVIAEDRVISNGS
jgi:hypothetical protein